jgi:hypothetical protein
LTSRISSDRVQHAGVALSPEGPAPTPARAAAVLAVPHPLPERLLKILGRLEAEVVAVGQAAARREARAPGGAEAVVVVAAAAAAVAAAALSRSTGRNTVEPARSSSRINGRR